MPTNSHVRFAGLAVCAALAAGLATTPVMAQSKGSMHVTFGDVPGGEMVNFMAAVARAEARGVEVKVSFLQSEETAAQAIVSGQADIGVGTPYALIQKVKAPIRMFFQLSQLRFFPVVNSEKYKEWKDLDGADIAVHGRGSGTEAIMHLMAKEHGIKFNSVSYVPGSGVRAGALMQGRITASIVDYERKLLLENEAPGKFIFLPVPALKGTDEALYANVDWLNKEKEAVGILLEELLGVWREVNKDPASIAMLRDKYNVLPDLEKEEVDSLVPAFTQGVEINLYGDNGGSAESVKEDFNFYTTAGSLEGDPATLKVEDYWYLDPLNAALDKLGRM